MAECYFCNKPATGACAECRKVTFCSRACLELAWRHGGHAEVCRLRKEHLADLAFDNATYNAETAADQQAAAIKGAVSQQQERQRRREEREKRLKEALVVQETRRKARLELLVKLQQQQRAGEKARAHVNAEWAKLVARIDTTLSASERPEQWDTARATRAFEGILSSGADLWNGVNDADAIARTIPLLMEYTDAFLEVFGVGASVRAVDTDETLRAVRGMYADQMAQLIVEHAYAEGIRLKIGARDVGGGSTTAARHYYGGNDNGDGDTIRLTTADTQPEWLQSEEALREHDRFVSARLDQAVSQIDESDTDTQAFVTETRRDVAKKVSAMSGISDSMRKFLFVESKEVLYGLLIAAAVGALLVVPGRMIVSAMEAAGQEIVNDVTKIGDMASVAAADVNEANAKLKPVISLLDGKLKEAQAATDAATSLAADFVSGTISLAPTTDNVSLLGNMLDTFREESIANFMSDGSTRAEATRQFLFTNKDRLELFDKLKASVFEKDKTAWLADWAFLNKNLTMETTFTKPREIGIYLSPLQALFALDSLKFASSTLDKVGRKLSDLRELAEKARAKMDEYREQVAKYRTRSPVSVFLSSLMARATGSGTTEAALLLWYSNDALLRFQQLEEHFNVVTQLSWSALSNAFADPFAIMGFLNVVGRAVALLNSVVSPLARGFQGIAAGFEKALVRYYGRKFPGIAFIKDAIGDVARSLEKASAFLTVLTTGLYLVRGIVTIVSSIATIMIAFMGTWIALLVATTVAALTVGTIIALLMYQKTRPMALGFISWFGRFVINYHFILAPVLSVVALVMQTVYANTASLDGVAAAVPVAVPQQRVNPAVSLADLKANGRILSDELKNTQGELSAYTSDVARGAVSVKSVPEAFEWINAITGAK